MAYDPFNDPERARGKKLVAEADIIARKKSLRLEKILVVEPAVEVLTGSPQLQAGALLATVEQAHLTGETLRRAHDGPLPITWFWGMQRHNDYPIAGMEIGLKVLRRKLPFTEDDLVYIVEKLGAIGGVSGWTIPVLSAVISLVEKDSELKGSSEPYRHGLEMLRTALSYVSNAPERKMKERVERLMAVGDSNVALRIPLYPGEAWSDSAIADLSKCKGKVQTRWADLLAHCVKATSAAPSEKWAKQGKDLVMQLGKAEFCRRIVDWFGLVDKARTEAVPYEKDYGPDPNEMIIDPHMDVLRGLAWCAGFYGDRDVARALGILAKSGYRKVALIGPRAVRVGNAAVTALGLMPGMEGVYQLALLKVKVKFRPAQKTIEKGFNVAAEREGLPREEIEELAVPSYGLTEVGELSELFDEFTARLRILGTTSTELVWLTKNGKVQKSLPTVVKEKFGNEIKELKAAAKDIEKMLPAQRERIDGMFLQQRVWPVGIWREQYLEHPLVGTLARRILWEFGEGEKARAGIWFGGRVVDLDLREIELKEGMTVRLWHPIGKDLDEVMGWRGWLEAQGIQQPFKQAHREIYLLTEAEARTGTYSNRFAAHILKQHQFSALCAARGWKNKLRLMVDAEYEPPTLFLPQWGLRAEFWVEGIGDDYGGDTTESGAYLRLVTDQVRFYRIDAAQRSAHAGGGRYHPDARREEAEPIRLNDVPPLVLSEVMRDVDLFVGVASVGNDPTWSDGGPNGRFAEYWQSYSFGELNATAKTRKDVLMRLVPKLKIAKKCEFEEKFLVVKGSVRTYRIHLGSGNILMKPNDQYLCIVPKGGGSEEGHVMLPFEGDRTLSLILSKAFLLAEDAKIKDATIVSQIRRA